MTNGKCEKGKNNFHFTPGFTHSSKVRFYHFLLILSNVVHHKMYSHTYDDDEKLSGKKIL